MKRFALLASLIASAASAQVEPIASGLDPRIQNVHYVDGQVIRLQVPARGMLGILLGGDEYVKSATLRDPGSYRVTVVGAGDALFVQATGVQATILSVATDRHTYELELNPSNEANVPYLVRFASQATSPGQAPVAATPPPSFGPPGQYKVSGNKELRPSGMRDDGTRTYIQWRPDQAIPAVFALDTLGREEMVNGYMRGDVFTIDRVHGQLVFRIDKAMARARRFVPGAKP